MSVMKRSAERIYQKSFPESSGPGTGNKRPFPESRSEDREREESAIRKKLGIPEDAQRILIFSESSHWDPNWLLTSKEYFRLRVRRILGRASLNEAENCGLCLERP